MLWDYCSLGQPNIRGEAFWAKNPEVPLKGTSQQESIKSSGRDVGRQYFEAAWEAASLQTIAENTQPKL